MKLKHDEPRSISAFNFNVCRYNKVATGAERYKKFKPTRKSPPYSVYDYSSYGRGWQIFPPGTPQLEIAQYFRCKTPQNSAINATKSAHIRQNRSESVRIRYNALKLPRFLHKIP